MYHLLPHEPETACMQNYQLMSCCKSASVSKQSVEIYFWLRNQKGKENLYNESNNATVYMQIIVTLSCI